MPIFQFLRKDGLTFGLTKSGYQNSWRLATWFPSGPYETESRTLSGYNQKTLKYIDVKDTNNKNQILGNWPDGEAVKKTDIPEGDGTVLNESSIVANWIDYKVDANHGEIMYKDEAIRRILDFIGLNSISPVASSLVPEYASKSMLSISINKPITMTVEFPDKKTETIKNNLYTLFDPETGVYKIGIKSNKNTKANIYILSADGEEDKFIFEEIDLDSIKPSNFMFIYNPRKSDLKLIKL